MASGAGGDDTAGRAGSWRGGWRGAGERRGGGDGGVGGGYDTAAAGAVAAGRRGHGRALRLFMCVH
jgi:hypothetical protein